MNIPETAGRIGEFLASNKGTAIGVMAVGSALTLAQVEAVVVGAHGDNSHRANSQSRGLKKFNDHMMWLLGTDAKSWASAHVGDVEIDGQTEGLMHHGMTDANIYPATAIEQYLRTIEADPEKYAGFPTPPKDKLIPNLDPSAHFTYDEVREVGSFGIAVLEGVLGQDYEPPVEYTIEEAQALLDVSEPKYFYGPAARKPEDEEYTQEEMARILLADPYSPALEPLTDEIHNGGRGIDKNNVKRYQAPVDFFRRHPEYITPMLRDVEVDAPKIKAGMATLFGSAIVGFTAYRVIKSGLNAESVITGAVAGAAAAGIGAIGPIQGGKKVNGYGHYGLVRKMGDLAKAWRNKPVPLVPDTKGTYMTKLENDTGLRKVVARVVDFFFAGELIGQPEHHREPQRRHYSDKSGTEGLIDNPPTFAIQHAADRSLFGLRPGKGFKNGSNPDMVNSIVKTIQDIRVRTVYPEIYAERLEQQAA